MTNEQKLEALAQSIYLAKNNRYNDVDGSDLTDFVNQTIDWVNQWVDELEAEADWNYVRVNDQSLGTVSAAAQQQFTLPATVNHLVFSPYRDVKLSYDGAIIATFALVAPSQIADPTDPETHDRATVIGNKLIFSRPFTPYEVGATVSADVINYIPRLSTSDTTLIDLIKPAALVILGVAKNATLPDVVQGGISPSLTQKYNDLLQKAVADNNISTDSSDAPHEDFSFINGVW